MSIFCSGHDADAIRGRLRQAGWVLVGEFRTGLAWAPRHRVSVARGHQLVTGKGATAAEAWAEAERLARGGAARQAFHGPAPRA